MPEESPAPDVVELQKRLTAATDRGDVDAVIALYSPDAVYDMSAVGMGSRVGPAVSRVPVPRLVAADRPSGRLG